MREGPPYQDNTVEQNRSIEDIAEDFVLRFKAGELVPLEGVTGSRNLGVYDFEGKIAKVVKQIRAPKQEVVQELVQSTEDYPRVIVPEHVESIDESRSVLLMENLPLLLPIRVCLKVRKSIIFTSKTIMISSEFPTKTS